MIPVSIIETDGYLEEVRRIQPASVLRQLSPGEGAHGTSSVASARLILQRVPVNSYPNQVVPCQLVLKPTRT